MVGNKTYKLIGLILKISTYILKQCWCGEGKNWIKTIGAKLICKTSDAKWGSYLR